MDKTRDKLLQPEHHDPYLRAWHQRSDTLCPRCGAAYQAGRWTWHGLVDASNAQEALCPACQRIAEDVPAGTISLRGAFVKAHADELSGLIRNTEEKEKGEHPLERLMAISDQPDGLRVTTTGLHLAQRIGHALEAAYDGDLKILYDGEAYYVDVHWLRD
ncbi:ATPase [Pseudomonas stutzeri]|uniref:BCAM0308 family protein n=1 Tax=Stutzerimonas stutzeri TaxID=316 RepID=UPI001A932706|nr:BCAM0308 family protein [Stutzerimonas stutzeri]MBO0640417.1 ATPase [Stutzerimonas stutzeri]MCJ0877071.1 ATPase [Pseudomonas sp. JI-2]